MTPLAIRVAARYLLTKTAGDLPMGKTFQNEQVRIHRYRESFQVTDLKDAGKRGKTCEQLNVQLTYQFEGGQAERDAWLDEAGSNVLNHTRSYEAVKGYFAHLKDENPRAVAIDISKLKSIAVEPFGEVFEFKVPQRDKGFLDVKVTPNDFMIKDRHWMNHPTDPDGGGHFQDTLYSPDKKKDAQLFYAWMKDNHERARRFLNMDMFRKTWQQLGVKYDYH